MPPAFFTWLGGKTIGAFFAKVLINIGISAIVSNLTKPDKPDRRDSLREYNINVRGTTEHQRIIYGETLAAGMLWFIKTAGKFNEDLYQAITIAGHECEDITDMWIDKDVIPAEYIDWAGDGGVTSGDYRGYTSLNTPVHFEKWLGSSNQEVSSSMLYAFPTEINSETKGRGQTWFLARLAYTLNQSPVWSAGAPNSIRALTKGKKIYDPRSDDTQSFGTGPLRLTNSLTWLWSDNPALCWADYMIDNNLGLGEDYSKIDYGYVASAAEICDTVLYTSVGTDKRFRCNGTLSTADDYKENIERILSSMNGQAALQNGTWKLRGWAYETPTLQFTDDDLRDDIRINLHPAEKSRYNEVRGTFIDKGRQWEQSSFPPITSSEYLFRDNMNKLSRDISLQMTTDLYMAQRLAAGTLELSDLETSVVFPSNYKTLPAEVGGTLMYSNEKLGWADKVFQIQEFVFKDLGGIDLLLREENPGVYADISSDGYLEADSFGSYPVNTQGVPPPSNMSITNQPESVAINWDNPAPRLYEYTEIFRSADSNWNNANLVAESRINNYIDNPPQNQVTYYWLRSKNYFGEVSSYIPVGSDQFGVNARDSLMIVADPGFDLTKPNTRDRAFWHTSSLASGNYYKSSMDVRSLGTGTGSSQVMKMTFIVASEHDGLGVIQCGNKRVSPIIRGLGALVTCRYRVTTYMNIGSAYVDLEFKGKQSLFKPTVGVSDIGAKRVDIPNSVGWTVVSHWIDLVGASNVGSFSYCYANINPWINYTATTTGYLAAEFDDFKINFQKD